MWVFMLAFWYMLNWIVTDFTLKTDVPFSFSPIWMALVSGRNQYSEMYWTLLLWLSFRDITYIWLSVAQGDGGVQVPWVMALFLLQLLFGTGVLVSSDISTWMLIKRKKASSCCQSSSKCFPFPSSFLIISFDGNSIFPVSKAHNLKVLCQPEPSSEARVNQIICETALVSPQ